MVKKGKAKSRLDKFYHLAKEQGFRSRAAFKLVQLNRKFEFLNSARILVDLCAAPGGWMQVAVNNMPVSSKIIGVDLAYIKPVRGASAFIADITTPFCLGKLRTELRGEKADVVLNDGAPNVGTSWEKDAFSQNELVLSAVKLATQILRPGGTFVTKVFRSADYNSLLWVFGKLFKSVTSTKPVASRTTSAEIFVVCQDYLAPKTIDPKLLDPRHVFMTRAQDAQEGTEVNSLKLLVPAKEKKAAAGYSEDRGMALFRKTTIVEFVNVANPFQFLVDFNQLTYDDEESQRILALEPPFTDFEEFCEDLRLLGRAEFQKLLKWRARAIKHFQPEAEAEQTEEVDSDAELEQRLLKMSKKEKKIQKKQQELERRKRKLGSDEVYGAEPELFSLQDPEIKKYASKVGAVEVVEEELEEGEEDSSELEYEEESKRLAMMEEEMEMHYSQVKKRHKASEEGDDKHAERWFEREEFKDLQDFEVQVEKSDRQKRKDKLRKKRESEAPKEKTTFDVVPQEWNSVPDTPEAIAETIALGTAMLRKKRRREIEDWSYNKYTFEDKDLPDWFEEDQKKHYTAPLPITQDELDAAKAQLGEINVRTNKKALEAIARRKKRLVRKLETVKQKAEAIANQDELSENLKMKQIDRMYRKELNKNKTEKKYVVMRKSKAGSSKPHESRFLKRVDKRLKKDKRATKARHKRR
jgi:AdoMet-dependent rRNA methyltransferase SPB1